MDREYRGQAFREVPVPGVDAEHRTTPGEHVELEEVPERHGPLPVKVEIHERREAQHENRRRKHGPENQIDFRLAREKVGQPENEPEKCGRGAKNDRQQTQDDVGGGDAACRPRERVPVEGDYGKGRFEGIRQGPRCAVVGEPQGQVVQKREKSLIFGGTKFVTEFEKVQVRNREHEGRENTRGVENGQVIRVERGEVEEFVNAGDEQWVEIGAKTDVPLPRELTATVHQQVRHFGRLKITRLRNFHNRCQRSIENS